MSICTAPTLEDLPLPPPGKIGWPWTEQSQLLPERMPDGSKWPRISIVTPSYNQGEFIEETIRSVLLQGYPNLEYIIIDGGSTDKSVEIIKKYETWLTFWVSEQDQGQTNAINKGLRKITGDIWAYLNSDDYYTKNSFNKVVSVFISNAEALWVTGYGQYVNRLKNSVQVLKPVKSTSKKEVLIRWESKERFICIEVSNFMKRDILSRFGFYDESLNYCMDFDFNLRLFMNDIHPVVIPDILAEAYIHPNSKTGLKNVEINFNVEELLVARRYLHYFSKSDVKQLETRLKEISFWVQLAEVKKALNQQGKQKAFKKLVNMFQKNPLYLLRRPMLGMVRRIAKLKLTIR